MAARASTLEGERELTEVLQALLGRKILVVASLTDPPFSMTLQARVMGIEEASPDEHVATLHFGASNSLTLPLDEIVARHGSSRNHDDDPAQWVELQLPNGPTIMIEELPAIR